MFKKNNLNDSAPRETPSDDDNNTNNNSASNISLTNSISTGGSDDDLSHDLTSLFECPVCYDYVLPPILQCSRGHLVCISCRSKLTHCPTCRDPLADIRNLALEKVAMRAKFPSECKVSLAEIDYEELIKCPCPGVICEWQGPLYLVLQHLMTSHVDTLLIGDDIEFLAIDISTLGPTQWVMMQKCFGLHFMIVLDRKFRNSHEQFFAVVQLIGSRQQAESFVYRLELNGSNRRKLAWESTPLSIHDSIKTAMRNSACLVFDTSSAKIFINDEDNLSIAVTISLVRV